MASLYWDGPLVPKMGPGRAPDDQSQVSKGFMSLQLKSCENNFALIPILMIQSGHNFVTDTYIGLGSLSKQ